MSILRRAPERVHGCLNDDNGGGNDEGLDDDSNGDDDDGNDDSGNDICG